VQSETAENGKNERQQGVFFRKGSEVEAMKGNYAEARYCTVRYSYSIVLTNIGVP